MIISKKKFNQEIEKALQKENERRWQYERMEGIERNLNVRIDRMEERMYGLERQLGITPTDKKECVKCVNTL